MTMKALRLKIYQPSAHYRIPFTYQRRHTYPIPPYSTVIGLLANFLGIRNLRGEGEPDSEDFRKLKGISISVGGTFIAKTKDYVWFRNLGKDSHESRFHTPTNRRYMGIPEHPGGQMPVSIDVLNDVHLWIYLYHKDEDFLERIQDSFLNPRDRVWPPHLGRAEDLIVPIDISTAELTFKPKIYGNYRRFFWVPEGYTDSVIGLMHRIPTFYRLESGARTFEFAHVYLSDGIFTGEVCGYFDEKERTPVFFWRAKDGQDTCERHGDNP
ncbi:MAG: type I-B CRISPR-associated protein Cas5 [Thermotogae bacterium]|nr:type I-B CRISPR-associated protein Cas5 [Thermotogota bacterium]